MEKEIVSTGHPHWNVLRIQLDEELRIQRCNGSLDITERILISLPNVDVGATLDFLIENEGRCDCEILHLMYAINDSCY
ncbi:DUF2695 domain-containing protein [Desulfopila inferna]|uniref:DUF2695 domain-containing protein n=1 Tax=Desulfopila inferna TaxID=468528 RepID=UPI001962FBBA|nr:DUF2695 domain-containing protein [Desulfopila inferna]MBM9604219.1 DUF2695 domain-containing protein [Desulfopila inferna]